MGGVDIGATRILAAALILLSWLVLCGLTLRSHRRQQQVKTAQRTRWVPGSTESPGAAVTPVLVCWGSQTGNARQLASGTARALASVGLPVRLLPMAELTATDLHSSDTALFLTSTYGEGDPPDDIDGLLAIMSKSPPSLVGRSFAVLALGDRHYRNFCGFGNRLDRWLRRTGATALFDLIEVDNLDPVGLRQWRTQLAQIAGKRAVEESPLTNATDDATWVPWQLLSRRPLNAGSPGEALFHVVLQPAPGLALAWEAGDLIRLQVPDDPRPRDYSIASLRTDGVIDLLVRQQRHADGSLGLASGWLTRNAAEGAEVRLQWVPNPPFRIDPNQDRRLILIGNGSGLAGLRAHLRQAQARGRVGHWLIFGERDPAHDRPWRQDIETWLAGGVLARADLVFSRASDTPEYVQDRLRQQRHRLSQWIDQGAAVYVCGSALGMAGGVQAALVDILGADTVEGLRTSRRYRRDVY